MEYIIFGYRNIVYYFVDFVKVWNKLENLIKKFIVLLLGLLEVFFFVMLLFLELLLKYILSEFLCLVLKIDVNCLRWYILNILFLFLYIVFDFIVFGIIFFF